MKRIVKRVLMVVGALIVTGVVALLVFFYGLHPKFRDAPTVRAPSTPEAVARGKYLAVNVAGCASCHSPVDEAVPGAPYDASQMFAGRVWPGAGLPGQLTASNLTSDKEHGIGAWTDGEVLRAMREGVGRDGRALFPIMPYQHLRTLPDDDALAIVAYLRTVPPIAQRLPPTSIGFPVSMFVRLAPAPLEGQVPAWGSAPAERGKHLLSVMGCIGCHTPVEDGRPVESKAFAGGMEFQTPYLKVYAANITPAGIGNYSDAELMAVMREGKGRDGRLLFAMPWTAYAGVTEADLRAVIAGLRELAPIENVVPTSKPVTVSSSP
jgi:mono/diheme cytochrome c family protein